MRGQHRGRFTLACVSLLLLGAVIRYHTGWLMLPWAPAAAAPGPAATLPPELRTRVEDFYQDLDRGQYAEAYGLALENHWTQAGDGYHTRTLTTKDDFIAACTGELGENGSNISLVNMDIISAQPLLAGQRDPARWPGLLTLAHLPPGTPVESVYQVEVGGSLLENCTPADFHKTLLVANVGGLGWRLLLPGSPEAQTTHLAEWFLPQDVWAGRQIQQETVP